MHHVMKKWLSAGNLEVPNLLLIYYRDLGLTHLELIVLLQLKSFMDRGESFPSFDKISERTGESEEVIYQTIHHLINQRNLAIRTVTDDEGKSADEFSLDLIWEKIIHLMERDEEEQQAQEKEYELKDLYSLFEKEFGRPLSPMEMETLNAWMNDDQYAPELIELALKEAVLNQVHNFKYIDRILLSWEKKNLKTKEQVTNELQTFRKKQSIPKNKVQDDQSYDPVPMIDWLRDFRDK